MVLNIPPYTFEIDPEPQPGLSLGQIALGGLGIWAGVKLLKSIFNGRGACDTYKYVAISGNRVVHGGITNDLFRREGEHRRRWRNVQLVQVGRRTNRVAALAWERANGF